MNSVRAIIGKLGNHHETTGLRRKVALAVRTVDRLVTTYVIVPFCLTFTRRFDDRLNVQGVQVCIDRALMSWQVLAYMLRGYEAEEIALIERYVDDARDIIELGAGIGIVACYTNRKLGDRRKHVVLEANPRLIEIIRRNREENGATFECVNAAYAATRDQAEVFISGHFLSSGTMRRDGREYEDTNVVQAFSLRALINRYGIGAFVLIADIEGGEYEMLENEQDVLAERCALMIVECHEVDGRGMHSLSDLLDPNVFECIDGMGSVQVVRNRLLT